MGTKAECGLARGLLVWTGLLVAGAGAFFRPGVAHAAPPAVGTALGRLAADERALDALMASVVGQRGATAESTIAASGETDSRPEEKREDPPSAAVTESDGDRCSLFRVELPSLTRRLIGVVPVPCGPMRLSADGQGGTLIWAAEGNALLLVDGRGRVSELPIPRGGTIERVGHHEEGAPLVLTATDAFPRTDARGRFVIYRARRIDFSRVAEVGTMKLAHALKWDGARWIEIETAATNGEACDTAGVDALAAARLLDGAAQRWSAVAPGRPVEGNGELDALVEPHGTAKGSWHELPVAVGRAYAWTFEEDFSAPSGLVVAEVAGALEVLPTELDGTETAHLAVAGRYLLVAKDPDAAGRIFDASTGRVVLDGAAAFWPTARRGAAAGEVRTTQR